MKIKSSAVLAILLLPLSMLAQGRPAAPSSTTVTTAGTRATFVYRGELGKWWQNSDIAKKLQLSDGQITQLDQTFYDHKLKLIDYGADMEKQDLSCRRCSMPMSLTKARSRRRWTRCWRPVASWNVNLLS